MDKTVAVGTPSEEEQADTLDTILDKAMADPEPETEKEPEKEPEEKVEELAPAVPAAPVIEPPADWAAEEKEVFSKLPPEARELALRQYKNFQADYTRKSQVLSGRAKMSEEVERMFAPYSAELKATGITIPQVIDRYIAAEKALRENPVDFIKRVAQNARIDLSRLVAPPADGEQAAPPQMPGLTPADVQAMVARQTADVRAALVKQQEEQAERFIGDFKTAKGSDDKPLHPHFDIVQDRMAQLIESGVATDLEQAYTMAVRSNEELFRAEVEAARQKALAAADAQRSEAVQKAKKATRPARAGNPPSITSNRPSIDEAIDAALSQHFE